MATDILIADGTPVVFADSTDYAGDLGTRTHQIDLTGITDTAARQSAKADLGATRARQYAVFVAIEFQTAPASGGHVEFYWGQSPSATAGTANPGGLSGSDSAYTGTPGDSLADSVLQLDPLGTLTVTSDASTTVQFDRVGTLFLPMRYGCLVVKNEAGQSFNTADAIEMGVALYPLKDQSQ